MKKPAPSPYSQEAHCPECGGEHADGFGCWGLLGAIIAWEMQDAALQAEHFKTVACYNLQHPAQFEEEALAALRVALIRQLDEGLPSSEIRKGMGARAEGKVRVLRSVERPLVLRRWPMTIASVYHGGQADQAAERVRQWAASIRAELD